MRITQNEMIRQVVSQVQKRFESLSVVERQMTTGLAIERPSDDPQRASDILRAQGSLGRGERYLKNAKMLTSELQAAESAVSSVNEIASRARATALQGANGSLSETDKAALAREVDGQLDELLRITNQRYGSGYLFGGAHGGDNPYQVERDENGEIIDVITPEGDSADPLKLLIGQGQTLEASISSEDVFQFGDGDDLFKSLIDLRNALKNGDRDALNGTLDRLQEAIDTTSSATTMVGSRLQTAQSTVERLQTMNLQAETDLSQLTDADAVETISRYNQEQAVYEVALQTAARVIQPSLVNFL